MKTKINTKIAALVALSACAQSVHSATMIRVDFQGLGPIGYAPVVGVFSNGSYDTFNPGEAASPELKTLAELGSPGPLLGTVPVGANSALITTGAGGAGVSGSFIFTVLDGNGLFNYASMLLPTNDWFIANPEGRDISALLGGVNGAMITFDVMNVWDAGTQLEDFAFSAGNPLFGIPNGDKDNGTPQGGVVTLLSGTNPFGGFANQPVGFDPTTLDFSGSPVARFTLTVVPEPTSAALLGLGALGLFIRRRR